MGTMKSSMALERPPSDSMEWQWYSMVANHYDGMMDDDKVEDHDVSKIDNNNAEVRFVTAVTAGGSVKILPAV